MRMRSVSQPMLARLWQRCCQAGSTRRACLHSCELAWQLPPVQPPGWRLLHPLQDLIKHALPQDLWFHVSQLSSAHVYLRLPAGVAWTDIPPDTLEDCAQLVKANSIGRAARRAGRKGCCGPGLWLLSVRPQDRAIDCESSLRGATHY